MTSCNQEGESAPGAAEQIKDSCRGLRATGTLDLLGGLKQAVFTAMIRPTIAISGVHSDPDPSPGIGIARSLRDAFPDATILAVDYSVHSSGLHHPVFDGVLLQPVWSEVDLDTYSLQIRQHLDLPGNCWISGLDVEIDWLASTIGDHPGLLIPSAPAQQATRKPKLTAANALGMRIPGFLPAQSAPTVLHELGRRSGWRLWVKGKYHEAYPAHGFAELRRQISRLEAHWPLEGIFVQQHVSGVERAIAFAAYDGRLLKAVEVEKRAVTSQGKTWAASVTAAPPMVTDRLALLIEDLRWTGGGEVEFVRGHGDEDWLIDFNPRFPAYIYGVTICGYNLPASLVGAALGGEVLPCQQRARQFIRVVHEMPVREDYPLPRIVAEAEGSAVAGKHPSFQPALVRRLSKETSGDVAAVAPIGKGPPLLPNSIWQQCQETPRRLRDSSAVQRAVERLASSLESCSECPTVIPALSIKTDPYPELAQAFLARGWWAEVISLRELDWAQGLGFRPSQIIFNGPATIDLVSRVGQRVAVAFADSVESLEALFISGACDIVGLRLRPRLVTSRFGIDVTDFNAFECVVACLRRNGNGLRLGVHIHFGSDMCGPVRWYDLLEHAITLADALSQATGLAFSAVDVGGGWYADDYDQLFLPALPALQARVAKSLPSVSTVFLEPGKALASNTAWLVTRILEVRCAGGHNVREVVVDGSIADLPMAHIYGHHVAHLRNGRLLGWLGGGTQRVLGSVCMETDILTEGVAFAERPTVGDLLLFSSAGGYNASMAWLFASGVSRDS
jgi:diaminopimelate decarboxylase